MSVYVIAKKDTKLLETIVFAAEGGDAVAVFSDPNRAESYIEDAGWSNSYTVATLTKIDFLEWLIKCHRNGVAFMTTNPTRAEHESNLKIDTLTIEAHLAEAGEQIATTANSEF